MKKKKDRAKKIHASKKWPIEQSSKDAGRAYRKSMLIHDAMQMIADAFIQCAFANGYSSGMLFSITVDGMEWAIQFDQLGIRNSKTGIIETPKPKGIK